MKKRKTTAKFLSLLAATTMTFSMLAVNVSAAGSETKDMKTEAKVGNARGLRETGTLTLRENVENKNSSYTVYKVLDAVIEEGQDVFEYKFTDDFKQFAEDNGITVKKIVDMGNGNSTYEIKAGSVDDLAAQLESVVDTEEIEPTTPEGAQTAEFQKDAKVILPVGYYLVLETKPTEGYKTTKPMLVAIPSGSVTENSNYSYDVEVILKDQPITTTKTVEQSAEKKEDSAAHQVGKEFKFTVVQDVPVYDDTYQNVVFKVTDTMSKGLDFVKVDSVKADKKELICDAENQDYGFAFKKNDTDKTTTLTFDFSKVDEDTNYYKNVEGAKKVTIVYTARLNKDATFGPTGETNEVYPTFGNNPGSTTDGGKDITINYAGLLELTKKDAEDAKKLLKDAEFTVYTDAACTQKAELVTYKMNNAGEITEERNEELSAIAKTDKNGVVRFEGLGDRVPDNEVDYWIKETDAPGGYVALEKPIGIIVKVKHPEGITDGTAKATFEYTVEGNGVDNVAVDAEKGRVTFTVNNTKGFTLPTTGGAGTFLFIGCGIAFFAIAVTMFAKSKKSAQK